MCFLLFNRIQTNSLLYFILLIIFAIIANKIFNFLSPQAADLVELSTCPICYGTSACDQIFNENFKIQAFDFYSILSHFFNKKNVFYGIMNGTRVVIKKLAYSYELDVFDRMLCQNVEFQKFCNEKQNDIGINMNDNINFLEKIQNAVAPNFFENDESGLILCPTTSHLKNIMDELKINDTYLWTLIKINPEPIILQILRANEGWPVAKYYGACGRAVVEKYVGPSLSRYFNEPWFRRAKIAIKLLEAVHMFTFRSPDFSFYLTDLSSDNIAVDENDYPRFVDLENVIILNRNVLEEEKPKTWHELHQSEEFINCDNCFSFSPMDICNHHVSDHNYYAVCRIILNGFLHNIPKNIIDVYPTLKDLLTECVSPKIEQSRIDAGNKLKNLLKKIITKNYYDTNNNVM